MYLLELNGKRVLLECGLFQGRRADSLERIFGMFQRATASREGTGIGLAIVRKVVERMGGEVGVESQEGHGSRFWVNLAKAP